MLNSIYTKTKLWSRFVLTETERICKTNWLHRIDFTAVPSVQTIRESSTAIVENHRM